LGRVEVEAERVVEVLEVVMAVVTVAVVPVEVPIADGFGEHRSVEMMDVGAGTGVGEVAEVTA
jgi:hypothetical protein